MIGGDRPWSTIIDYNKQWLIMVGDDRRWSSTIDDNG